MTRPRAGLRFLEEMRGYVTFGEPSFERGYARGRAAGNALRLRLAIDIDDVGALAADPGRAAAADGHVHCEDLGGLLAVTRGTFNLFVHGDDGGARMLYRLHFADGTGHPLTFSGFKRLRRGPPTLLWAETTTLYSRVVQGHVDAEGDRDAELVASGVLRVEPRDFLRQLTTFRSDAATTRDQLATVARFGGLFLAQLGRVYGPRRALW